MSRHASVGRARVRRLGSRAKSIVVSFSNARRRDASTRDAAYLDEPVRAEVVVHERGDLALRHGARARRHGLVPARRHRGARRESGSGGRSGRDCRYFDSSKFTADIETSRRLRMETFGRTVVKIHSLGARHDADARGRARVDERRRGVAARGGRARVQLPALERVRQGTPRLAVDASKRSGRLKTRIDTRGCFSRANRSPSRTRRHTETSH